jgi:hypothetical protein
MTARATRRTIDQMRSHLTALARGSARRLGDGRYNLVGEIVARTGIRQTIR